MMKRRRRKFCLRDDLGNYDEEIWEDIMMKIQRKKLWWRDIGDVGNYDEEILEELWWRDNEGNYDEETMYEIMRK